ncbi:MAG: hypothetical protein ACOC41_08055 [Chitinivibrionales bacterium]
MKRIKTVLLALAVVVAGEATLVVRYAIPRNQQTKVYAEQERSEGQRVLFAAGRDDRLRIIRDNGEMLLVRDREGRQGWVAASEVVTTRSSRMMAFDKAEVYGYLDDPQAIYIIDADDTKAAAIEIDRSFKEQLKENVDRETIDRSVR